jgi:hypothetical protein
MCQCSDPERDDQSGDDQIANGTLLPEGGCDLLCFLGNGNDVEFRFSTHLFLSCCRWWLPGWTRGVMSGRMELGSLLPSRERQTGTETQRQERS